MAEWLLYEHDDGRHAVAPSAEAATFSHGDPAWHRVGPVEVPHGLSRALQIVGAEIARAEALLAVEDGGRPVFDRAQTEAGIAALRTVATAIEAERTSGVKAHPMLDGYTGSAVDSGDGWHWLRLRYITREQADAAQEWLAGEADRTADGVKGPEHG